jgi:hypothetical protein
MSPNDKGWGAQAPSTDFAERATAAVLRDRALPRHRVSPRRWLPFAAACVLVASAAWAWNSAPRHVRLEAPVAIPGHDVPVPTALLGALPPPPTIAPPPPRPHASVAPSAPSAPVVAAPSASAPKVPLPSCRCNAFACECGPEP